MKTILLSLALLFSLFINAQIVNIPDANFKAALVTHNPVIDTNGDGEIQVSEASAYDGDINVSGSFSEYGNISDFTGIEAFTALTELHCARNQISSLDLSENTSLTTLACSSNDLTMLDISKNTALTYLDCSSNQLTVLNVSNNTALTLLGCRVNQITTLDVSKNTALIKININENQLTSIDISKNITLETLQCSVNQLTSLDLSKNTSLIYLGCISNQLTSLDISKNTALDFLACQKNQLTTLDMRNGNNKYHYFYFKAYDNPNLKCIRVDDSVWSTANWISTGQSPEIDPQASFSDDCPTSVSTIETLTLSISPNPCTTQINLTVEKQATYNIRVLDLLGKEILTYTFTGIKHTLSTSSLPSGTYLLQVISKNGVNNKKVIKK